MSIAYPAQTVIRIADMRVVWKTPKTQKLSIFVL